jgi:NAD+ synthase (glutamine-hydrolysing)
MQLAIAQLNPRVGDLAANAQAILRAAAAGRRAGASLLVTPELSLCGYPPEDLVLRPAFLDACAEELAALAAQVLDGTVLVGFPECAPGRRYNAMAVIREGRVQQVYRKQCLPSYTVFDEPRYFTAGDAPCVFEHEGIQCGVLICEDIWLPGPAAGARGAGAQLLVVANGSPYHMAQHAHRREQVGARVQETGLAVIYANCVGGQDELVFDGASFVMNANGSIAQQLPAWEEALTVVRLDGAVPQAVRGTLEPALEPHVYHALVTGVRDYVDKNNFPGVLLGLSGGVDSALTLAIAVDALGRDRVRAVMLSSPYTAPMSIEDARFMAGVHGVRYDEFEIEPVFAAFGKTLAAEFAGLAPDTTEENLQARIRGTLLMALSDKSEAIVLTTGNKSEMAVGYATLYGDMAGGFAVLKDVPKTLIYRLCAYRNALGRVIPERVIERAPSAELRPDQTDQDALPPYPVLDAILDAYVEHDFRPTDIARMGLPEAAVTQVVRLIRASEYKRRQAPVGIRISPRAFGRGWRYPITSAWDDTPPAVAPH